MKLVETLDTEFKSALKNKDAEKLSILRLVRSNIKNLEIEKQAEASDEDVVEILQREIKQHNESIEANKTANRAEEIARLEKEVAFLKQYLPEQLSSSELKDVIEDAITDTQAENMSDMGKVMGKVMSQVKGRTTGDAVNQMVRDLLSK
ncbi:MAG: glutamyl-tRNA amidotransferase [Parcubacteria group bacterium CG11_big_fil_rev_8_21_14_0_20_41_14]|nr:MAG: glutamyl-tRNA amidotransferase [Parcubacteria group bacterium CG11_big_fil_rev_8_21_14_0_20_41_14]PIR56884.1 MAG: glutamyl-tRNA amidotransferase [Parcubacteria group bacterium CG10_big_fil_rev_8_21_14_0_10_41_35]